MSILSPAIKVATAFTMGGAASATAGILLARHLSTQEFGHFSLVLAICTFSIPLGSMGLETIVLRRRAEPAPYLVKSSLISGAFGGLAVPAIAWYVYGLDAAYLILIGITVTAASVTRVGASIYQSKQKYNWSLWLIQSQNMTLILAAAAAGVYAGIAEKFIFSVYAFHWVLASAVCWLSLWHFWGLRSDDSFTAPWAERAPLFGHLATLQLFSTLDRFLIPKLLDIESLATFGVLAILIISPFKMFEIGMGYTLVPGLRGADSREDRKTIILSEARAALLVITLAIFSGFFLAPWANELLLGQKYHLSQSLIAAAAFAGALKVTASFASSIVIALGNNGELRWLNFNAWISLLTSVAFAWIGSRWGLAGLIAGFSVGSLTRIVVAGSLAKKVLHESAERHS